MTQMEKSQACLELDEALPRELQSTADYLGGSRTSEVASSSVTGNSDPLSEDVTMSATTTPATSALTNADVVAAARAEVQRMFAAENSQVQVAQTLEKYMTEANKATASLNDATKKITELEAQLAIASKPGSATNENVTAEGADKDALKWHGDKDAAYASLLKQVTDLTSAVAAFKKENDNLKAGNKKKDREDKIDKAKIKSDKFKKRATASKEDGSFVLSDEDFESALAEFVEAIPAETTETTTTTPAGTEQAAASGGAPIAAPADSGGPAGKQGNSTGTPIAAPATKGGPADKQTAPKMAHASEGTGAAAGAEAPKPGEQATASTATTAAPAAPDLSSAAVMAQATAAMLAQQGPNPSETGRKNYASAFGI